MSTRAQVLITSTKLAWEERPQVLYHHTDGSPDSMLPLFRLAFLFGQREPWRLGRVGKAASYLCAADPGVFEPEELVYVSGELLLHPDIEYYYHLHLVNGEKVKWVLHYYVPKSEFASTPYRCNLKRLGETIVID